MKSRKPASNAEVFGVSLETVKLFGYDVPLKAPTPREFIAFEQITTDNARTATEQNIHFAAIILNSRCKADVDEADLMEMDYTDTDEESLGRILESFFTRLALRTRQRIDQVALLKQSTNDALAQIGQVSTLS